MSSSTDWIHSSTLKMQKSPNLVPLGVWLKSLLIIENDAHLSHVGKTSLESPLGHEIETNVHVARRTRLGVKNCSCKKNKASLPHPSPRQRCSCSPPPEGKRSRPHPPRNCWARRDKFCTPPGGNLHFLGQTCLSKHRFPYYFPSNHHPTPHQRISHLTWTPKVVKRGNIGRSLSCPPARGAGPGPGRSNASHALSLD